MLSDITIIIPTKNRHHYLDRILSYFSNKGINVWVVDSSENKYTKELPDSNFKYFHFPNYNYCTKLYEISKKITTKYTLLCADDDFIIPESIEKVIDFLDQNPDYNSAQGNYISFYYSYGKLFYNPLYKKSAGLDLKSNKAVDRIAGYFNTEIQLYYCVHTTENFKSIFEFANGKIKNLNLLESVIGLISLAQGKHKVLPIFYSAREILYGSAGRSYGLNTFSKAPAFKDQYVDFFNKITELIRTSDNVSKEDAISFLQLTIGEFIKKRYEGKKIKPFKDKLIDLNKKIIPLVVRKFLRHQQLKMNLTKTNKENSVFAKQNGGYPFNDINNSYLAEIEQYIFKYNLYK